MANILNQQITSSAYGSHPQVPYGSRLLTIDGNFYIAESFDVSQPSTVIERVNEVGEPHGQVIIGGFVTGTATLQMPTSSLIPNIGDTFTAALSGSATHTFIISELSTPEASQTDKKVNITFRKLIA
jgi:translation initiation factor 2 gamma subunit (eIF-2gamma)